MKLYWLLVVLLVGGCALLGRGSLKASAAKIELTKPCVCSHCGGTGWIDFTHLAPASMLGQRTASGCRVCDNDGVVGLEICRDCGEVLPHEPDSLQERAHLVSVVGVRWETATAEEQERYHDWGRREWAASWKEEARFAQDEIDVMAAGKLRPLRDWSTHWSTAKETSKEVVVAEEPVVFHAVSVYVNPKYVHDQARLDAADGFIEEVATVVGNPASATVRLVPKEDSP